MLPFYSGATDFAPKAIFSNQTGLFELSGISRPENVSSFYGRLIDWLKEFEHECVRAGKWPTNGIIVNIKLTYCNSASTKYIFQMLEMIIAWGKYGIVPEINWYYDEGDDKMLDDGQDLSDALEFEFKYVPLN